MQEILANAKHLLGCVLIGCLIYLSIQIIVLVQDARTQLNAIAPKIETTAQNLSNASNALAKSSTAVEKVSEAQAKLLTNEKTATKIGVLVRKADNVARIIDRVESIVNQVDDETLPKANKAIDYSAEAVQTTITLLQTTDRSVNDLSKLAGQDLEALRQLLEDENLKRLLGNLADTSASVKRTAEHVEVTADEVKQAIPELIAELKAISRHVDSGTGEVATFLAGLNKPLSRKQKLYRALIQAAIIAAPTIIRR